MEITQQQRSQIPGSQEYEHPEPYRRLERAGIVIAALVVVLWPISLSAVPWIGRQWLALAEFWWAFVAAYAIAYAIVRIARRTKHP